MTDDRKITVPDVMEAKKKGRRLVMVTAYDYPSAIIVDAAGVDIALVGDSLGNVVLGFENTLPVTMDDMIRHTAAVARGAKRALVVADMPFLSYQVSPAEARKNAGRLVKEGGAAAVKVEGGEAIAETVSTLVDMGVPVMGHVGLTPQSVHRFGGFRVQGRDEASAEAIVADARASPWCSRGSPPPWPSRSPRA
jgi:3-methyl-2-oxobutanoate hydroxymethyltransferase